MMQAFCVFHYLDNSQLIESCATLLQTPKAETWSRYSRVRSRDLTRQHSKSSRSRFSNHSTWPWNNPPVNEAMHSLGRVIRTRESRTASGDIPFLRCGSNVCKNEQHISMIIFSPSLFLYFASVHIRHPRSCPSHTVNSSSCCHFKSIINWAFFSVFPTFFLHYSFLLFRACNSAVLAIQHQSQNMCKKVSPQSSWTRGNFFKPWPKLCLFFCLFLSKLIPSLWSE